MSVQFQWKIEWQENGPFLNSTNFLLTFKNVEFYRLLNTKNCRCAFRYKVEVAGKSLPVLTNLDKGRYGVLIFENLNKYLQMDKWNRELLDKYCREYSVGIVGFAPPGEESLVGAQLKGFPLFIHTNLRLKVSLQHYIFKLYSQIHIKNLFKNGYFY